MLNVKQLLDWQHCN